VLCTAIHTPVPPYQHQETEAERQEKFRREISRNMQHEINIRYERKLRELNERYRDRNHD
jgi:hypothetical protein